MRDDAVLRRALPLGRGLGRMDIGHICMYRCVSVCTMPCRLLTLSQHKAEYERRREQLAADRGGVQQKLQLLQTTLRQLRHEKHVSDSLSTALSS